MSNRNTTESAELVTNFESSLSLQDILPIPHRQYDKNRAPKLLGQPTVVYFHVTVLSLDSINEESMVMSLTWNLKAKCINNVVSVFLFADICNGYFSSTKLAWSSSPNAGEHERRVSNTGRRLVAQYLETWLFLQECQEGDFSRDEHSQSLFVALPWQNVAVYVEANVGFVVCHEIRIVSTWHSDMLDDDWELWVYCVMLGIV